MTSPSVDTDIPESVAPESVPEWAWAKAEALMVEAVGREVPRDAIVKAVAFREAFASYIAEHEEPPVDPLLVEAREIVAKSDHDPWPDSPWHMNQAQIVREGRCDDHLTVRAALNGLRRGIELAHAGES